MPAQIEMYFLSFFVFHAIELACHRTNGYVSKYLRDTDMFYSYNEPISSLSSIGFFFTSYYI